MPPQRAASRLPLIFGFGLLILLTVAATLLTFRTSFRIFRDLTQAQQRHQRVADALGQLRSDLYLAGILKRDFLLERNDNAAPAYSEQFTAIQKSAQDKLALIRREMGAEAPEALEKLRNEVDSYLRPVQQALNWEPVETAGLRWYLLRIQAKQRTTALRLAAEIDELNSKALAEQQSRIADAESRFRRTLALISGACVALGLLVAVLTVVHLQRLERRSAEMQSELRRLSQEMVKVQENERRTISRELHDEVGQMLTGLRMELANLDGPQTAADPELSRRLKDAKRLAETTLQAVRDLAMVLRPSMLDDLGLAPAINWHAREFSRRAGLPVDVLINGNVDNLPDEVRTCLYRVVQEALTNVARHAKARHIRIEINREADNVAARIQDDGAGFDAPRAGSRGVGLLGITERVRELSGSVAVDSSPGRGTRLTVRIPLLEERIANACPSC